MAKTKSNKPAQEEKPKREISDSEIDFYLTDLESRFPRDRQNYHLSYSGGKDSHFLYWFIKEYMRDDQIEIVSVNTFMEHHEIRKRMYENADRVLIPEMRPFEIKKKYGIPCFSKYQDWIIYYYQHGSTAPSIQRAINGEYGSRSFNLSKKARTLLLGGQLHSISAYCCTYLKKKPIAKYEKETGKHPIMGVRSGESALRGKRYQTCFTKKGEFVPLHDLDDDMMDAIYKKYNIPIPEIYQHIDRTGCAGCPYGSYKHNTEKELRLVTKNQRKFLGEYFGESYKVLGIDLEQIKRECGDFDD